MATAPVTVTANLNFNPASLNAAGKQVQSAFGNINIPTKQVNAFNNSLGRITGQASEFDKSINAATARVFAFGAAVSIINSISTAFKALISSTIEVEKRLTEIGSILGGTSEQLSQFKNAIFDVAKNTGQAFATVADGASELARQGLSAEETVKRLNAALILTRVSGLDAQGSVNALTAAINGFTSAGLTAEQIVNKLVAVDTAFAVSARDLAEAFSRAGSTAEDAGVSFDELLGLVTAVQQTTARGGAVIGNALKSIFSRLSRGTVIEDLQALGVEIDASQTGVQKLQALSAALAKISDPTQANAIKELAGGVYQINVVSAALKDLSSETSIFARASQTAGQASNEAFEKNAQLNQTLAAQINALVQGLTELGSKIGDLTLGPVIENLLKGANQLLEALNKVFDPEQGSKLIQGIFKGIGNFIAGPGLVIVAAGFFKLFQLVAKFAKEGIADLFKIGSEQERIKNIEGGIVALLQQDANLRATLLSSSTSQAQKEQAVINAIKQQNALLAQQQALVNSIASAAAQAGVGGFTPSGGFTKRKGKGMFAAGYAGNVSPEEAMSEMMAANQHGYKAGKVKKGKIFDGTGSSFTGIWNDAENRTDFINSQGYKSTLITPPNGFAASGFVPNFTRGGKITANKKPEQIANMRPVDLKAFMGSKNFKQLPDDNPSKIAALEKKKTLDEQKEENLKNPVLGSSKKPLKIQAENYGYLIPNINSPTSNPTLPGDPIKSWENIKSIHYQLTPTTLAGPKIEGLAEEIKQDDELASELSESVRNKLVYEAITYAGKLTSSIVNPKMSPEGIKKRLGKEGNRGLYGAVQGAAGAAFEAAVTDALGINEAKVEGGDWDAKTVPSNLKKLFGITSGITSADFKVSTSSSSVASYAKKILNDDKATYLKQLKNKAKKKEKKKSNAAGFIPNFNSLNKGVPVSQIRAHFDEMGNPVAVTNTRDEPNGLKDAIGREKKGIRAYTENMAARGFIPNYAKGQNPEAKRSIGDTIGLLFGLNTALGALGSAFSGLSEKVEEEIQTRDDLNSKLEQEKQKENPNIKEIERIEKTLESLNSNIEAAEEESKKMEGLFSDITTALNLAISGREIAGMFGGAGGAVMGGVDAGEDSKDKKSKAKKVTTGSAGNFGDLIGNTIIPNKPKIPPSKGNTSPLDVFKKTGKFPAPTIPPSVGPNIGKGLAPAVTRGLSSIGPAIKSVGPLLFNGIKSFGPLLFRGLALATGPIGIFASIGYAIKDDVAEFISSRVGAAKELEESKPLDDARTAWLEARLEAKKLGRELDSLTKAIEEVEGQIKRGEGEKTITRSLTNTGELSRENLNKFAAAGSESKLEQLKTFNNLSKSANDLIRSQKARGPQSFEEQIAASQGGIEEELAFSKGETQLKSSIDRQEFAREQGKLLQELTGSGIKPTEGQRDVSSRLSEIDRLSNELQNLDVVDNPTFETDQANLQAKLLASINSLEFDLNTAGDKPATEEQRQANAELVNGLKNNTNTLVGGQTKLYNDYLQKEYSSRQKSLEQEQQILNKFVDDWNANFSENLSSLKSSFKNIKEFNVGSTVSQLSEGKLGTGSLTGMSSLRNGLANPEGQREALEGRLGAAEFISGQADQSGLSKLLSPDQLREFRSNVATQTTLGKEVTAVRENLIDPAAAKIEEKFFGKEIKDESGRVTGREGGLQGDAKQAAIETLDVTVEQYLNKLKEIGESAGSTRGGQALIADAEYYKSQINQPGGPSLEQLTAALKNIDLKNYANESGLTEEQKIAAESLQTEALASANETADIFSGENLGTAQESLNQRTEELASLFKNLGEGIPKDLSVELPKITETVKVSFDELNKKLASLKESAEKTGAAFDAASKAAENAATNLSNIKAGNPPAAPAAPPAAPAPRPAPVAPQGT